MDGDGAGAALGGLFVSPAPSAGPPQRRDEREERP